MLQPKFIYLDLGKVLVDFDVQLMCRQMADVAGVTPQRVHEVVFDSGLQRSYELGQISSQEFYEQFCNATGARPDYDKLSWAGSAIFALNVEMVPIVTHLALCGHRLGVLSNTCQQHWDYCARRFRMLTELFPVHALSYQMHACKPQPEAYSLAAELAGCHPQEIFFTDDTPGHVAAAQTAGFDAVPFTGARQLAAELRRRGVVLGC